MNTKYPKWTQEEDNNLIKLYSERTPFKIISKLIKRTNEACIKRIRNLGYGRTRKQNLIVFNRSFFSSPKLLNSYWAGFIAADGCILSNKKLNRISIKLSIKDEKHLQRFLYDIEYDGKLKYCTQFNKISQKSFKYVYIDLCDKNLVLDIITNFNIHPQKTYDINPPNNLTHQQNLSFIGGLIDGDGTIYRDKENRLNFSICSVSYELLIWIKNYIDIYSPKCKWGKAKILSRMKKNKDIKSTVPILSLKITGLRVENFLNQIKKLCLPLMGRKWDCVYLTKTKCNWYNKYFNR